MAVVRDGKATTSGVDAVIAFPGAALRFRLAGGLVQSINMAHAAALPAQLAPVCRPSDVGGGASRPAEADRGGWSGHVPQKDVSVVRPADQRILVRGKGDGLDRASATEALPGLFPDSLRGPDTDQTLAAASDILPQCGITSISAVGHAAHRFVLS